MRASQLSTARRGWTADIARTRKVEDAPGSTAATLSAGSTSIGRSPPVAGGHSELLLSRYRLLHRLGAGAFGVVWMARDERLDRDVAVKVVPRERIVGGRFEREARAAARLSHPGIVTLYEAVVDDDGAYLVSELVRGETLRALLAEGRLSDRGIVAVAISLCDALTHAHSQGVIHRDVKPSNILVPERASSPAHPAKLTDFGVARVIGGDSLTRTGDVIGTAAYMAPEQAEGREAQAAADLYALALVVYEALTGVNPVRTVSAVPRPRRLGTYLPPLRRQRRQLPRALGCGIDLALRPRPRERGTLLELRAALVDSLEAVDDTPGVVVSGWQHETSPPASPSPPQSTFPAPEDGGADPPRTQGPPALPLRIPHLPWAPRAAAATATAATTGWLVASVLGSAPLAPAAAAIVAAILVLVLPRLGWLVVTAALVVTATVQGRPGAGILLALAMLVPVLLLPRSGTFWGLSALAPALGLAGLAGAWPAFAAQASRSAWRRAALGVTGWVWLALASPLAGADLYTRQPALHSRALWTTSPTVALHDVLAPLTSSGILAGAIVWGLATAVLPWLLRRRSLVVDCVLATIWAAVTVAATLTAIAAAHGPGGAGGAPTALLGALAGGIIAIAPTAIASRRRWRHAQGATPELP